MVHIRCFDCGELKEAKKLKIKNIIVYQCRCEECDSTTTSSHIDRSCN
ncbi:MAG: hypothetical protein ACRCVJ_11860 [Clostridium sp.]